MIGAAVQARRISAVLCSSDLARSRESYEKGVGLTLSAKTILYHLLFESWQRNDASSYTDVQH